MPIPANTELAHRPWWLVAVLVGLHVDASPRSLLDLFHLASSAPDDDTHALHNDLKPHFQLRPAGSAGTAEGRPSNYANFDNPAATDIPEHVHVDCSDGGGAGAGVEAKDEGECVDRAENSEQDTGENGGIASFA